MNPPPDPLDSLLAQWEQHTPAHRPLAPEVWRRLVDDAPPTTPSVWDRLHTVFARPSFAVAFVSACVLLGLFLAEVRRSRIHEDYNRELMQSYLRLIDPLLEAADTAAPSPETAART